MDQIENTGGRLGPPQNGSQLVTDIEPVVPSNDQHMAFVGQLAAQIDAEYEMYVRKAGGLTPAAMQEFVGRYLGALQPMTNLDITRQWYNFAMRWPSVASGVDRMSVEEFLAHLLLFVLRMGHDRVTDVYSNAGDLFEEWLENAQAMERNRRLRAETGE